MSKLLLGPDEEMWRGRFISVAKRPFTNTETGKEGHWEMVKREARGRIVGVIAVTPENEAIIIKIFRVPLNKYVLECAAGLPDKAGEPEIELARRELLEETGYACRTLTPVVSGPINGGLVADEMVFFLGLNAQKVAEPTPEDAEDIEVLKVPVAELPALLKNPPEGVLVDFKIWALLPFLPKN
ncbi:MAG: hypothetical protein A3C93_01060 [Candidatus Lloydbacteria bacterium RIFCSPHIGHO2_02_FULL_54_17]|uniref:Nudix hydrolase domain-containing protein n=1 Tax=Candidatus Lloydbacteria bacterium RIFCSPHIGHO2_02_FULL_54_17 TaxID=1798664 RepID=A0A1G2DCX0_9BACT|nr:MAG: hypothetical protein A2762_06370 [Candidatus Lloydbacteria bacterium RIFCSPHIGHO2_01_FULL_54_11]OGZ11489.1 MAG: hypothetical protein A3C93_01060 [Candidatus Lloydbacteria bacterium RIFCSPHIGHO2_02_FULL_54_17]OGZ14387.1 MAG: hypothetical protein A2948_00415 [Candidatus Lloydbacteria bacterium RIFCSPLOWO2_01_FULL_54_18]OGZ16817.1 MAG: hypothetical protein A3H76_02175 [Candidatus Lloydbacteria bacterium RIFCSPLOWO2_02_FULL_54_12]